MRGTGGFDSRGGSRGIRTPESWRGRLSAQAGSHGQEVRRSVQERHKRLHVQRVPADRGPLLLRMQSELQWINNPTCTGFGIQSPLDLGSHGDKFHRYKTARLLDKPEPSSSRSDAGWAGRGVRPDSGSFIAQQANVACWVARGPFLAFDPWILPLICERPIISIGSESWNK